MWIYIIVAVLLFLLLKELIRLPTVGKYGERYVFITGCDTGFGNLLAKRLDNLGFNVFAGCFSENGADELRKVSSGRLKTLPLDVTKAESITKARKTVESELPTRKGLWAVVNNAGITGPFADSELLTRVDYEACLAVNLYGVIDVTRVFQPLVRKGQGRFVNMSSIAGRFSSPSAAYAVSKYGVEAFSDCLRREVLKQGMTVHIIEPNAFKTDILNIGNITRTLRKTYDRASPEVQLYYGKNYVEKVMAIYGPLFENASPNIHWVVDAYTHAITAMFPRYRYLVGNTAKYFLRLVWNLPEWISDAIFSYYTV